jgi:hypothetical protein
VSIASFSGRPSGSAATGAEPLPDGSMPFLSAASSSSTVPLSSCARVWVRACVCVCVCLFVRVHVCECGGGVVVSVECARRCAERRRSGPAGGSAAGATHSNQVRAHSVQTARDSPGSERTPHLGKLVLQAVASNQHCDGFALGLHGNHLRRARCRGGRQCHSSAPATPAARRALGAAARHKPPL